MTTPLCSTSPLIDTRLRYPARPLYRLAAFPPIHQPSSPQSPPALPSARARLAACKPWQPDQWRSSVLEQTPAARTPSASAAPPFSPKAEQSLSLPASTVAPPTDTPPRSCGHSIPLLQTTRFPPSAAASAPRSPADPMGATAGSPQTGSCQNRCADSTAPNAATARSADAASAAAPSSVPRFRPPTHNARYSISPTRSDRIPSPAYIAGRLYSTPQSRSGRPAWSPFHALRCKI